MIITTPTDIAMSGQRQRRARRMNGRRQRLALGSVVDHGAEIKTAIDMAQLIPSSSASVPADHNIDMSAQRQRRAQRMATRRQRLNLGPASDHAADIAQVVRDFSAVSAAYEAVLEVGSDGLPSEATDVEARFAQNNKATSLAYLKSRFRVMPRKLTRKMRKWFGRQD